MYLLHSRFSFLRFSISVSTSDRDVAKSNCHLCAHWGSMCLEIRLKNKFKDSSEGLGGGDKGVFPIESLVCSAYCVYSLFQLLKPLLVWSLSQGLLIRRATGSESANLRQKNTERRKHTCKDIRAMTTESNRKYIKNPSNLELT